MVQMIIYHKDSQPCGCTWSSRDLTTDDNALDNLTADEINNQSNWDDDDVKDDSGKHNSFKRLFMRKIT